MGHPSVENRTPFAFEAVYLTDEEGRPVLVSIVRASFDLRASGLRLAATQQPVPLGGETWGADSATSSYRYEPEVAFVKPATDLVLIGHAHAPRHGVTEVDVGFQVGRVSRKVRVIGDRVFTEGGMTKARPFETIPLLWERAFGGWDRTAGTAEKPQLEPRNPVGRGFRSKSGVFEDGVPLPNIEDPSERVSAYGDVVTPVGFGFTSASWQPRAALAGTYDAAWEKDRMPLLPRDFDRRFFNAAAPGLVLEGRLRGDEAVSVTGASPSGQVSFRLPGVLPPTCRVAQKTRPDALIETVLDTVVVNLVFLTFRGFHTLQNGPHDVAELVVESSEP